MPELVGTTVIDKDEFLILATDGIWDMLSTEARANTGYVSLGADLMGCFDRVRQGVPATACFGSSGKTIFKTVAD